MHSIKLEPEQKNMLKIMSVKNRYYFAWGLGTGKTFMGAVVTGDAFLKNKKTLVVCTPSLIPEWQKFLFDIWKIPDKVCSVFNSLSAKKKFLKGERHNIVICSYQTFLNKKLVEAFVHERYDMIILDEAHRVKSPQSKTAKAVYSVCERSQIPRRYLFSGTMITRDYKDVFMQFKIMDGGKTFGTKYSVFEREYFYDKNSAWKHKEGYFPKLEFDERKREQYMRKVKNSTDLVDKVKSVKLPDYEVKNILLPMGTEQKQAYDKLFKDSVFLVEEMGKLYAAKTIKKWQYEEHILGVINKLRQVASGFYYYNVIEPRSKQLVQRTRVFDDCPKAKFLESFLRAHGKKEKIIVWFHYRATLPILEKICAYAGVDYAIIMGGSTAKKREVEINKFKDDVGCSVLLANPKSGGEGLNLAISRVAVYYTQDYSYKDDYQSAGRNYRRGSDIHDKVVRINLRCKESIDQEIFDNIKNKSTMVKQVVTYIKNKEGE